MKILHIGVYDRNIGDNIALAHIEYSLEKYLGDDVLVSRLNLEEFWRTNNSLDYVRKIYNDYVNQIDYILIGGGGLLECSGYDRMQTGWKLPFDAESLRFIKVPIIYYGVGVNTFRGGPDYSLKGKTALENTIGHATAFSVRNDGSFEKLRDWIEIKQDLLEKVKVVPDPGLLHLDYFGVERKSTVTKLGFQPAVNHGPGINKGRFGEFGLQDIKNKFKNVTCYPHTHRDFQFGKPIISENAFHDFYKKFVNLDDYLQLYKQIDFVIAMRGHGQMITIGMNIPGIYLSTQDKVRDFSLLNGFEDYNVDMADDDWKQQLEEKEALMREENSEYLRTWYEIRDKFISKCTQIDKEFIENNFLK